VPGKVLIQTRNPEHVAIRLAAKQDRAAFVEAELAERRDARYPPFYRLLLVRLDAADVGLLQREAERLTQLARRSVGDEAEVMGPSPAPIERVRNRFRYRLIVRSKQRAPLHRAAHALMATKLDRRVRIVFDIDPVNML
jgi:primosomal protein N' (replication factor Y)